MSKWGCKKNVRVTLVKTKCSPDVPPGLFPPKKAVLGALQGGEKRVQGKPAVACNDAPGLRVLCRVEHGAFAQQVRGAGEPCSIPGVVPGGENRDGERLAHGLEAAGEFGKLAADLRVEFRRVAVEALAVGRVQDYCGLRAGGACVCNLFGGVAEEVLDHRGDCRRDGRRVFALGGL